MMYLPITFYNLWIGGTGNNRYTDYIRSDDAESTEIRSDAKKNCF